MRGLARRLWDQFNPTLFERGVPFPLNTAKRHKTEKPKSTNILPRMRSISVNVRFKGGVGGQFVERLNVINDPKYNNILS